MKNRRTLLAGIAVCATLLSFVKIGGQGFTVRLNNQVVLEHYYTRNAVTPELSLAGAAAQDQLSIDYNECGQVGKGRSIRVTSSGETLKQWTFDDGDREMVIAVKDLKAIKSSTVQLVYASKLVSNGRVLATVTLAGTVAKK